MLKRNLFLLLFVNTFSLFSQVGINIEDIDPSAILQVFSDDKGVLYPRVELKGTKDVQTIPSPAVGLMVFNLYDAAGGGDLGEDVKASNFYYWTGTEWTLMVHKTVFKEVLDEMKIPQPVILELENDILNFLSASGAGGKQSTPMKLIVNSIPEYVTYDYSTNTLTLKPGTYTMDYVYEAQHYYPGNSCTLSSYIVDFPTSPDGLSDVRIHSTASHKAAAQSGVYDVTDHGGTISCSFRLTAERNWRIEMGRGQSGNCTGTGNTLKKESTHLAIIRYGD